MLQKFDNGPGWGANLFLSEHCTPLVDAGGLRPVSIADPAARGRLNCYSGCSMPFVVMTAMAAGVLRKSISRFAASGSWAAVLTAAVKTMKDCNSRGRGPTNSTPV